MPDDAPDARLRPALCVFVVPTRELVASVRFYREGLGLDLLEEWSDHGRGALFALSEHAQVELVELADVETVAEPRSGLGLQLAIGMVDVAYTRLLKQKFQAKAPPRVRPWGMRGFSVLDPNGIPINIYEPAQ